LQTPFPPASCGVCHLSSLNPHPLEPFHTHNANLSPPRLSVAAASHSNTHHPAEPRRLCSRMAHGSSDLPRAPPKPHRTLPDHHPFATLPTLRRAVRSGGRERGSKIAAIRIRCRQSA